MFYVLNADDPKAVKAVATKKAAHSFGNGLWVFSTAEELQEVAGSASMATIDGIYNALTGNSVGKARDKAASCARLFKAVLNAAPVTAGEAEATSGNGADINGSDALSKLKAAGKAKAAAAEAAAAEAAGPKKRGRKPGAAKAPKADKPEATELETAFGVRPGTAPALLLAVLEKADGEMVKIDKLVKKLYDETEVAPRVGVIRGMIKKLHATELPKGSKTVEYEGKGLDIQARLA